MLAAPTLGQGTVLGLQQGGICAPGSEFWSSFYEKGFGDMLLSPIYCV